MDSISQVDSLLLVPLELSESDLVKKNTNHADQKVVSGSRSLQDLGDLPITMHVITKDEIQKYGYVTLVDALKHLPGIRVSQPGSALEGETFQMRGLRGNSYCKILINNVPIKPIVAAGMPLGAQLPIQQAERIEVIYGPAAAIYGSDASAGVINIILEKSERPTFVQANLSAGNITGYTDLNLLFGGQLGRNKRVLNFSIYGSTTILDDRPIVDEYAAPIYSPYQYAVADLLQEVDTSYTSLSNYSGSNAFEANFSSLPHLSRMFGADLYYNSWKLSYQRMYRRDHSAIGLNPLTISYDNPQTYFGENLNNFNLGFAKSNNKFGVEINLSALQYNVDNRSSSLLIRPSINRGMNLAALAEAVDINNPNTFDFMLYDSLKTKIYDYYFSGNRFSYANSFEMGIEQVYNFKANSWLDFSGGSNFRFGSGSPLVTLARRPINTTGTNKPKDLPIPLTRYNGGNFNAFLQSYISSSSWNITLGLQYYAYISTIEGLMLPSQQGVNPRIAALYKVNKKWSLRAFYGTAFRLPSPYYYTNTFKIDADINRILTIAELPLDPELTTTYELGSRFSPNPQIKIDVVGFYTYTDNVISYNFATGTRNLIDLNSRVGYFNNRDDVISVLGAQGSIDFKDLISSVNLDARLNFQYASSFQSRRMNESSAPEVPNWAMSGIVSFKPFRKLSISLLNVYQGKSATVIFEDKEEGYYLLDTVFRLDLSDKFQVMFKVNNLFNNKYAGLLATNTVDDLYFNPQATRTLQVGLSYRTN